MLQRAKSRLFKKTKTKVKVKTVYKSLITAIIAYTMIIILIFHEREEKYCISDQSHLDFRQNVFTPMKDKVISSDCEPEKRFSSFNTEPFPCPADFITTVLSHRSQIV